MAVSRSVHDKDGKLIATSIEKAARILGCKRGTIRRHIDSTGRMTSFPVFTGQHGGMRYSRLCAREGCAIHVRGKETLCAKHQPRPPHKSIVRVLDIDGSLIAESISKAAQLMGVDVSTIRRLSTAIDPKSRQMTSTIKKDKRNGHPRQD
jgi:hypothetical protein